MADVTAHAATALSSTYFADGNGNGAGGGGAAGTSESGFVVELTAFSGPLDLLLTLIREEQVDIYDIPIARIAEQFLAHIHLMQLDQAAAYLEMAARLIRIKAQMLLPRGDVEAWADPRAELVRRLLEYQQMREVVDVLERRGEERRNQFARAYLPQARFRDLAALWPDRPGLRPARGQVPTPRVTSALSTAAASSAPSMET